MKWSILCWAAVNCPLSCSSSAVELTALKMLCLSSVGEERSCAKGTEGGAWVGLCVLIGGRVGRSLLLGISVSVCSIPYTDNQHVRVLLYDNIH